MGCCLFALVLAGAPRVALILWWFFDSARVVSPFTTWLWPLLGLILLPWLTLAYVWVAPGGIVGFDWVILAVGLLLDIGTHGGEYRARESRLTA
ncbi:MAG: hypothetical protein AB2L09_10870 [Coriobacteriia bacterium]